MAPPTPPPRRAALAALSPNASLPASFDVDATKSPARRRRGSTAERRKLSQQALPGTLQEVEQAVWCGWLRKQSGAKHSGKSRLTVGSVLRKWDQRYFVVRRPPGQCSALIEWYRSEDSSCQPQHSFKLAGGTLRPADGDSSEHCVLLLPPMEPGGKSHRVTLKREGAFTAFATALSTCGVAVQLAPTHSDLPTHGPAPCAAVSAVTTDELGVIVQRAQHFVQAVATSVRRLQGLLEQGHPTNELHSLLDRLVSASVGAGLVVRSRQMVLTAETGMKLGLRLESASAADVFVQGGSIFHPRTATQSHRLTYTLHHAVRDVVDGGQASENGIAAGMVLDSINGCSVRGWDICDIEAAVASTPRPFTLTFTDSFLGSVLPADTCTETCAHSQQSQVQANTKGCDGDGVDSSSSSSSSSSSDDDDVDDDDHSSDEKPASTLSEPCHKRSFGLAMSTDAHTSETSGPSQRPRRNGMVIGQQPSFHQSAAASSSSLSRRQQLEQQLEQQRKQQRRRACSHRSFSSALSVSSAGSSSPGGNLEDTRARAEKLQSRREQRRLQHSVSQRSISSALSVASNGSSSPGASLEDPRARAEKLQQRRRDERRFRIQQAQEMMRADEAADLLEAVGDDERFEV